MPTLHTEHYCVVRSGQLLATEVRVQAQKAYLEYAILREWAIWPNLSTYCTLLKLSMAVQAYSTLSTVTKTSQNRAKIVQKEAGLLASGPQRLPLANQAGFRVIRCKQSQIKADYEVKKSEITSHAVQTQITQIQVWTVQFYSKYGLLRVWASAHTESTRMGARRLLSCE